jgi:hypothetical protein
LPAANKEQLKCFSYGSSDSSRFISLPSIKEEEKDDDYLKNQTSDAIQAVKITYRGIDYAFDETTGNVYSLDTYKMGNPVQVGIGKILLDEKGKPAFDFKPL